MSILSNFYNICNRYYKNIINIFIMFLVVFLGSSCESAKKIATSQSKISSMMDGDDEGAVGGMSRYSIQLYFGIPMTFYWVGAYDEGDYLRDEHGHIFIDGCPFRFELNGDFVVNSQQGSCKFKKVAESHSSAIYERPSNEPGPNGLHRVYCKISVSKLSEMTITLKMSDYFSTMEEAIQGDTGESIVATSVVSDLKGWWMHVSNCRFYVNASGQMSFARICRQMYLTLPFLDSKRTCPIRDNSGACYNGVSSEGDHSTCGSTRYLYLFNKMVDRQVTEDMRFFFVEVRGNDMYKSPKYTSEQQLEWASMSLCRSQLRKFATRVE